MNPRERIRTAIDFKEPDRVPVDNNGNVSGMHEVAYRNLLEYLNKDDDIKIYDYVQRLAEVRDEIKDMLGVDTRYIYPNTPEGFVFRENKDGSFKDEYGTHYRRVNYYADISGPVFSGKSLEEIKKHRLPDPLDPSRFTGLKEKAEKLHNETEYSLWAGVVNSLFYFAWCLRGIEEFMTDLYGNPPPLIKI